MTPAKRPIAFVLASTDHGSMIVNRNDFHAVRPDVSYGVGHQLLSQSSFDSQEVGFAKALLDSRRRHAGDGVVAIDGGANIGVHTIEWARHMHGWGRVISFEAQEVVFYALAGNVAINNCLNARPRLAALGRSCGELQVPQPDYFTPGSFGSLELRQRQATEFIGQAISYDPASTRTVPMVTIDSLGLDRLDFLKLDIEGMELDALEGARASIERHRPYLLIEFIKAAPGSIQAWLSAAGYTVHQVGINLVALHGSEAARMEVQRAGEGMSFVLR
jgi:FkbM family methyltransferase